MSNHITTIGKIHTTTQQRDAIHIAIAQVTAATSLAAGTDVGFIGLSKTHVNQCENPIGIIDPFLKEPAHAGDRVWLFLYPNTVTSLSHHWSHPAFTEEQLIVVDKAASVRWIEDWLNESGNGDLEYDALIGMISGCKNDYPACTIDKDYLHINGKDSYGDIPTEFWHHAEIVTGIKFPDKPTKFSCSC